MKGIDVLLNIRTINETAIANIKEAEMSWVLEGNEKMNKAMLTIGARRYKTYRLLQRLSAAFSHSMRANRST